MTVIVPLNIVVWIQPPFHLEWDGYYAKIVVLLIACALDTCL